MFTFADIPHRSSLGLDIFAKIGILYQKLGYDDLILQLEGLSLGKFLLKYEESLNDFC